MVAMDASQMPFMSTSLQVCTITTAAVTLYRESDTVVHGTTAVAPFVSAHPWHTLPCSLLLWSRCRGPKPTLLGIIIAPEICENVMVERTPLRLANQDSYFEYVCTIGG